MYRSGAKLWALPAADEAISFVVQWSKFVERMRESKFWVPQRDITGLPRVLQFNIELYLFKFKYIRRCIEVVITGLTRNQLGSFSPASSNLAICAKTKELHLVCDSFVFCKKEIRTGQTRSVKNSLGDCFGARVRAEKRRSFSGESRHLRQ